MCELYSTVQLLTFSGSVLGNEAICPYGSLRQCPMNYQLARRPSPRASLSGINLAGENDSSLLSFIINMAVKS